MTSTDAVGHTLEVRGLRAIHLAVDIEFPVVIEIQVDVVARGRRVVGAGGRGAIDERSDSEDE